MDSIVLTTRYMYLPNCPPTRLCVGKMAQQSHGCITSLLSCVALSPLSPLSPQCCLVTLLACPTTANGRLAVLGKRESGNTERFWRLSEVLDFLAV